MEPLTFIIAFAVTLAVTWFVLGSWPWIRCTLTGHLWNGAGWDSKCDDEKVPKNKLRHYWRCERCNQKIWHDQEYKQNPVRPNAKFPYFLSTHT